MDFEKWVSGYKVRVFPWIDGETFYVNVQYFASGQSILDCFRRVKYKLAMTGTITRNNISEAAPQLELLYNNSYNMISWAETLYSYEKGNDGDRFLDATSNPYYSALHSAVSPLQREL